MRTRILIVVDPAVYETVLGHLLRAAGVDEVFCSSALGDNVRGRRYDVAVVTDVLPSGVEVPLVIRLPQTESGTGSMLVSNGMSSWSVAMESLHDLFTILDELVPAPTRRTDTITPDVP